MSYEYGSQEIKIKNPFAFQGKLVLGNGLIFALLGIILFFIISARSEEIISGASRIALFSSFAGAVALTSAGIGMIVKGLFMVNKFYVGRGMPADLAYETTKSRSDYNKNPHSIFYNSNQLHKALLNRSNPSILEPNGLLSRLLHTYNPGLLYLPLQLRNIVQAAFEFAAYMIGFSLLFLLSILSGFIGVNEFVSTPIWKYVGWGYVLLMFAFIYIEFPKKDLSIIKRKSDKYLLEGIAVAILIPVIAAFFNGARDLSVSPIFLLVAIPLLSILNFSIIYFLTLRRIPKEAPKTEVSEFREQWEESVNPPEIFRNVDMTLADYRYLEIANRKYRDLDTGLIAYEKGEYSGSMMQETQPVPIEEINDASIEDSYKKICASIAQFMILGGGIWLFYLTGFFNPSEINWIKTINGLAIAFIITYVGRQLYSAVHTFFGEVRFKSYLIHFFADGTFNKSKISMGMSVYDSMRSENEVVRTSIRPWIVCSEIETTTFAISGSYNLEQYRLILEMKKDDVWLDNIVTTLRNYLKDRKKIAETVSEGDLENTARMAKINQVVREGHSQSDNKKLDNNIAEIMNDEVKEDH